MQIHTPHKLFSSTNTDAVTAVPINVIVAIMWLDFYSCAHETDFAEPMQSLYSRFFTYFISNSSKSLNCFQISSWFIDQTNYSILRYDSANLLVSINIVCHVCNRLADPNRKVSIFHTEIYTTFSSKRDINCSWYVPSCIFWCL